MRWIELNAEHSKFLLSEVVDDAEIPNECVLSTTGLA